MLKRIGRFVIKIQRFFDLLLSDNHAVSLKRFVSICAFILFTAVTVVGLVKNLTEQNVSLLKTVLLYLAQIISIGILGVAATDIFKSKND